MISPGQGVIRKLILHSAAGGVDITQHTISVHVYEDMKLPEVHVKVVWMDANSLLDQLNLIGEEEIDLAFEAPGLGSVYYGRFRINSHDNGQRAENMRYAIRSFTAFSPHRLNSRTQQVQKSFKNITVAEAAKQIHQLMSPSKGITLWGSSRGMIGGSDGTPFILHNINPLTAMQRLRTRAVSERYPSSFFSYFENKDGFTFAPIEEVLEKAKSSIVAAYIRHGTMGKDFLVDSMTANWNILSVEDIRSSGSTLGKAQFFGTAEAEFDFKLKKYEHQQKPLNETGILGAVLSNSAKFFGEWAKKSGATSFVPRDSAMPPTHLKENMPKRARLATVVGSNLKKVVVYLNPDLTVGKSISISSFSPVGDFAVGTVDSLSGVNVMHQVAHHVYNGVKVPSFSVLTLNKGGGFEN